eukprot:4011918-Alexandrium_andersonii.AAC.1
MAGAFHSSEVCSAHKYALTCLPGPESWASLHAYVNTLRAMECRRAEEDGTRTNTTAPGPDPHSRT